MKGSTARTVRARVRVRERTGRERVAAAPPLPLGSPVMRRGVLGLAFLALIVLFTGLSSVGYLDVREARDQAVARELIARHEVFTPVLGGRALLDKPTLGYGI